MRVTDVVVVGAGNAALCSAIAASERGATVKVLEFAPEAEGGGNSAFTGGAMRVVFNGLADLQELMPDLSDAEMRNSHFGSYSHEEFFADMARVTESLTRT